MSALRVIVGGLGALALLGALAGLFFGAPLPTVLFPALFGVLLICGTVFERIYYKRVSRGPPGRGWAATGERFVDPATGRLVEVYFRPATGQRAYVDVGEAPPQ